MVEVMAGCLACGELVAARTRVVAGQFPAGAEILLLGEAPGATEDAEARPFVGRAGRLLDAVLTEAGLSRPDMAVINVVKCRPPGNRAPTRAEVATCRPWTERQIDLVDPLLVVTLGLTAATWALGRGITLSGVRGHLHRLGDRPMLATYHPSAALRFGPAGRPRVALAEDLRHAARLLPQLRAASETTTTRPRRS